MQSNAQFQDASSFQRNVSSTASLFSFDCPVYMTESVWKDCVELVDINGRNADELAILQRLRHVLFMASSARHGCTPEQECKFSIHRVPNDGRAQRPEKTMLKLEATSGEQSQIIIRHLNE